MLLKEKIIGNYKENWLIPLTKIKEKISWVPQTEAGKLVQFVQAHWDEHLLSSSQMQNRVLKVNPDFPNLPLGIEKGKPSPLALFVEAVFTNNPKYSPKGNHALEIWPRTHKRSALLGRVIFADDKGQIYRDIDLKGIGWIGLARQEGREFLAVGKPGQLIPNMEGRYGLFSLKRAENDFQMSQELSQLGIRTARVLAIIGLEELIVENRKCSLTEAIKLGLLDSEFEPVIAVRAFGTKARVIDILDSKLENDRALASLLLEDAITLVSQELNQTPPLSPEEYLLWFAKTLGRNVGLMHKNCLFHYWLTPHNITLDCRIVDLDTVSPLTEKNEQCRDIVEAQNTFGHLFDSVKILEGPLSGISWSSLTGISWSSLIRQFQEEYDTVFPPLERTARGFT